MSLLSDVLARARALLRGGQADREHQDEVRFHLEMEAAKGVRAGMARDDAIRRARLAFGSVEGTREAARDARGVRWLEELAQDLRYAARQLRRSPGFTVVAITTLALGIGANTALFSVVDGVLLRPIPFADAEQLVVVWETDRRSGTTREPASWPDYVDLARESRTLSTTAAFAGMELTLTPDDGEPLRVPAMGVTHGYFALVGMTPLLGRAFDEGEDRPGGPLVAMVGERFWRSRLAGDPTIVGRTIRLDDELREVVGVVPAGADFGLDQVHARAAYGPSYTRDGTVDVWLPLQASEASLPRDTHPFFVLGRLAAGTTLGGARDEAAAIAARLEELHRSNDARGMFVEPLRDVAFAPVRPVLLLLVGAVALVLLVACVNVANLLLARGAVRMREVAVREAMGASFGRLCRQFLAESTLLAVAGAALGCVLAVLGLRALLAMAPAGIPRLDGVAIDARVLAVTLAVSLVVGVGFGIVPALQALRVDVIETIRGEGRHSSGSRRGRRLREGLVVAELALAVTLVLCTGLLLRSVGAATAVDPGFRAAGVLKAEYQLPEKRYPRDFRTFPRWPEHQRFNRELLERVRGLPGVEAATIAAAHPLNAGFTNSFVVIGREEEGRDWPEIALRLVTPGYLSTMGVALTRGRDFEEGDDPGAPRVILVNEAASSRFFAASDPIGQVIRFWGMEHRVVGVVANERFRGLTEAAPPAVYASLAQAPSQSGVVLVRTAGGGEPAALAGAVREAVRGVDPALAVYGVEPLAETLRNSIGDRRFALRVLGAFAALTLVLALIGIHGVLRYATAQRTREIGIRLALGATRGGVAALVVRRGLVLAAVGTVIGLLGAAAGSRLLTSLLFGVSRGDPLTYAAVGLLALVTATLATALPALGAARVPPVEVMRE